MNDRNQFETYCYTNIEHRQKLKEVVAYTASLFDEFILDEFFFTNCKGPSCIAAKGGRSWTDFRLDLMTDAARVDPRASPRGQPRCQGRDQVPQLV